jgi:type I restriction enzyme S subunit
MKQGWEIKRLGEVCELMNGYAFQSKQYTDEGYFVIRIGNVQDGYIELNNPRYIKLKEEKQKKFILQCGDILISLTGNVGRVGVIDEEHLPAALNQRVAKISIKKEQITDKEFLLHFLSSEYFISELIKAGRGAAQQNISTTDIENLEIPLPPLPEQQRIAAILDEAFAAIAKAKANAEQNLKNAKELFESYLQGVFENGKWDEKTVGEVAQHSLGKMLDKNKNKGKLQKYLRNQSVRWFEFDLNDLTEMPFLESEKEKFTAIKGDVLICEGGYPGRAAIWQEDYPIYFQKAIHRVRFYKSEYNKWFLYYLFLLDRTDKLKSHFTGTGIQHFTGQALSKLTIPIPPFGKVTTIVQKFDALSNETKKLEAIYQQKINDLEELKKSVLQKAFSGGLN